MEHKKLNEDDEVRLIELFKRVKPEYQLTLKDKIYVVLVIHTLHGMMRKLIKLQKKMKEHRGVNRITYDAINDLNIAFKRVLLFFSI